MYIYTYFLSIKIDKLIIVKKTMYMKYKEFGKLLMDEDMIAVKKNVDLGLSTIE